MSLTKTQIEAWNPATLTAIGDAWTAMGTKIDSLFGRYKSAVANVNGGHWQGVAADAAMTRAESDRQAAARVVDHLDRVAKIATDGFHQIDAPLQRARNAIAGAQQAGFTVSENLVVSKADLTTSADLAAQEQWQIQITSAADATEQADTQVKDALNAARLDLQVAFIQPATLGTGQGTSDGNQLLNDPRHLSADEIQRLTAAGLLTPAQLTALQSGATVDIPASQMQYINALARSLDGKSPQQIETILNEMPAEARQGVANALQLLSTNSVSASVTGDSTIPAHGATNLLPHQMYDALNRGDLMTEGFSLVGGYGYNTINLNGVAANQANAAIAAMASPGLKHGSGLDKGVLNAAQQYLRGQVAAENDKQALYFVDGRGQEPNAPMTEQMFSAVANDKAAVSSELTGPNGQTLLSDVFNHQWSDHGKTVSQLFNISSQDAVAVPGDRPSEVRAAESGQIAQTVAQYMSNHSNELLHLSGDPGTAVGQRNPDLMINLASDLAPYYSTFAGSESIPGVSHFANSGQLANMYSVLATNPTAGVNAAIATFGQENALATAYGSGHAPYTYAQTAGQMQHALEVGTQSAETALNQGDVYKAQWQAAVNGASYDTAYKAAGAVLNYIPEAGPVIKSLIDVAGPAIKPDVVGIVNQNAVQNPSNAIPNEHAANQLDTNTTVQSIVNGLVTKDPSIVNDPAFAPYRHDDNGNPTIQVSNLSAQAEITKQLYSRYGIDVGQWEYQFDTGMNGGTIIPAK
ncbi:hypothetical protein A5692_07885 [Mycobacterium sp. E342]|uniref:TPR repeat region-containing protein n=1 Tax=Mycobacterium sp. E342 TaxID=1834147 RepID=UPI00080181AB|nr:hypothetical protein [Mycobacterium sp. E342]OBH39496.1 hypothetical protein A5692_07885 [Mycobacterium sp. E342]